MGLARLENVVSVLIHQEGYPSYLPIGVIERASLKDQRVILSTLRDVVQSMSREGEQRPPGMMVIGWSVLALDGKGDMSVLDSREQEQDGVDEDRVTNWLEGKKYKVSVGMKKGWIELTERVMS